MIESNVSDRLIVAMDLDAPESMELARRLSGHVGWLKVGMTLFYESGPQIVRDFSALGFKVFLDLKLHDIPHQVEGAARRLGTLGAGLITVHASGGADMIRAARQGALAGAAQAGVRPPSILAVTVLTSMGESGLTSIGVERPAAEQVDLLARMALGSGADGVVCSPGEASAMRAALGDSALVVTPGVRPAGSAAGDQSRVATPAEAIRAGSSHLVVGRPITGASDPVQAVQRILAEMKEGFE
jgi:orotidine-5'-phosphate decarboxylase